MCTTKLRCKTGRNHTIQAPGTLQPIPRQRGKSLMCARFVKRPRHGHCPFFHLSCLCRCHHQSHHQAPLASDPPLVGLHLHRGDSVDQVADCSETWNIRKSKEREKKESFFNHPPPLLLYDTQYKIQYHCWVYTPCSVELNFARYYKHTCRTYIRTRGIEKTTE